MELASVTVSVISVVEVVSGSYGVAAGVVSGSSVPTEVVISGSVIVDSAALAGSTLVDSVMTVDSTALEVSTTLVDSAALGVKLSSKVSEELVIVGTTASELLRYGVLGAI
jgi:hypothetical protein